MSIGFFNSSTPAEEKILKNFIGVHVEGPTRVGHYFAPMFATADGRRARVDSAPVLLPDSKPRPWSLRYVPADGTITVTLDKESKTLTLKPNQRRPATFDRFGVFTPQVGGSQVKIYLDDLTYTASR
jgi:hypothetical protein